jgi:hypothetical protein
MDLAFLADDLLQRLVPKHKIKFLNLLSVKVRHAVKSRGECWRITPLPRSEADMRWMITASKTGIGKREIYYHNKTTGTRWLTCQQFIELAALDDRQLAEHLDEIRRFSARMNPHGYSEIDFFMADVSFSQRDFAPYDFGRLESGELRRVFHELSEKFHDAVPPEFQHDDLSDLVWRNQMFTALIAPKDEVVSDEMLLGLSPEFFMQIQWLPGGRIDDGELIFDSIFEARAEAGDDPELDDLCDEKARAFIFNFVREYADLEYVNVGRVVNSLSRRAVGAGRRDVYVAELKQRGTEKEIVRIIRMQKWGVREHLEDKKPLLVAMMESDEYTEYLLDRRLACRQLGMKVASRLTARKICEKYLGHGVGPKGILIWSPYIERDYVPGIATDKVPPHRFEDGAFSLEFTRLLGEAAALNLVVGRCDERGNVLFDDGDELLIEDDRGVPLEIIVADLTGTFRDFRVDLRRSAHLYAGPVNRRVGYLPGPTEFASVYLDAFADRLARVQEEYRNRKRAFDTLFKFRKWDPNGSFAFRWHRVLERLRSTDLAEVVKLIREAFRPEVGRSN